MSDTLLVTTLGTPTFSLGGRLVGGFVSARARALALYLAVGGRSYAREVLAALLWPELGEAQARKNLRDLLSNLRRLLGPRLELAGRGVAIRASDDEVDYRTLTALAAAAARADDNAAAELLARAVALYRGEFLEGLALPDAPEFEAWAAVERERARRIVADALLRLAELAGRRGDEPTAVEHATRLITLEPLREDAQRLLIRLHAQAGDRSAAVARYEALRRTLADELGLDPEPETEALFAEVLEGTVGRPRPALDTPAPRPLNLVPAPLGPLIGRDRELSRVCALLDDPACRLVTLAGIGGVGKTRLALAAALALAGREHPAGFAHGVAFVSLAGLEPQAANSAEAPEQALAAHVAEGLRFSLSGGSPPFEQLAGSLGHRSLLLVLDNCEHLPDLPEFVVALLARAPGLKILATSRSRLNLGGEVVVELAGLGLHDPGAPATAAPAEALKLFEHVAASANPALAWDAEERDAAARICAMVEGLPLGIELAAGLTRMLPCAQIAHEIAVGAALPPSLRRDLPERQRSLQRVFDYSWQLLGAEERRVLARLAVFRGGFSREAARAVAGAELPQLGALLDHCLLARRPEQRYELLDLVRAYAGRRLADDAAEEEAACARHADYVLSWLATRGSELRGAGQRQTLAALRPELANIRAAWRWAIAARRLDLIAAAADGLFFLYEMLSRFQEGAAAFAQAAAGALAGLDPDPARLRAWARLQARAGWFSFQIGHLVEGRQRLEASVAALAAHGELADRPLPLNYLAAVAYYEGNYAEAEGLASEALEAARAAGERHGAAVALTVLGQIAYLVGRYPEARRCSEESLAIERSLGNRWGEVFPLISLGRVARAQGDHAAARGYFAQCLADRELFGDMRGVALCHGYLGDAETALGDHAAARRSYERALALFRELGVQAGAASALARLGQAALALGQPHLAHSELHEALDLAWQIGSTPAALEALAGVAAAVAPDDEATARGLVALVLGHPAATQESRDRAAMLQAALPPGGPDAPALEPLEQLVPNLLRRLARLSRGRGVG